uniref:NAD-dependent protein deacetylase n=1 Tax=Plectus sambesii TaxID=2011161 RepID=A0A914USD2_9BILA
MTRALIKVADIIKQGLAKKIVVLAGAGISTPSGLPDFRSPNSGLYDNLEQYSLPYAEAVFDIEYFVRNPVPFFQVAKKLYPGNYAPNSAHSFIKLLQDKNMLLRMYTQNIDGLERLAGIKEDKLIEAHGSFSTAACIACDKKYTADDIKADIFSDRIPKCTKCQNIIKPKIVFFGEMLPKRFMMHLQDLPMADLLIVMGTSLEVYPFSSLADAVSARIPRILINKKIAGTFKYSPRPNDLVHEGDIVEAIEQLTELCGWKETSLDC